MKADSSGSVQIASSIKVAVNQGMVDNKGCSHIAQIKDVNPSSDGCEDCLRIGDEWVKLRLCLICGHVGCCDDSKNKHASRHYHETEHSVIVSYEEGENWLWCYVDKVMIDP